ncbi:MAG: ABC-type polysaccharide/polyol phosphate transport system ATPase subunit [Candidatus Azotimanducaceae bacterium]|jgi:ABC-type polysaccharide/polyol phosphate transport system ATPase subunit
MYKIELENVCVVYESPQVEGAKSASLITAADGISTCFNSGDLVGVIGRNGAGKSTLLSLLAGNLSPQRGVIKVKGERLALINRSTGLIPKATLAENAKLKGYSFGLKGVELSDFVSKAFEYSKLGSRAESRLNSLSRGMAGRFNIALNSQVVKPITILDEWVGTLDVSGKEGNSLLNRLAEDADIVILASHNQHLIKQLCNRVILMEQGTIFYDGTDVKEAFKLLSMIKKINDDNQLSAAELKERLSSGN